jgi:uncharacterized membrane protein YecN with MAPEG domain
MDIVASPVFHAYIVSAVILGMNLLVLANNTALTRAFANEAVNPEDQRLNAAAAVVYEGGNDRTSRYRRAHRNALENVPLFLVTGFLLAVVGAPAVPSYVLFGIFVAARLLHSVAYVNQLQPWRTASFAVGALVQVAILVLLAWETFSA